MKTLIKGLVAATNNTARAMVARVYEAVTPAETSIEEYRKDPGAYEQKRLKAFVDVHSNFGYASFVSYAITGRNRKVAQTVALTGLAVSLTHIYDLAAVRYHANKLNHPTDK